MSCFELPNHSTSQLLQKLTSTFLTQQQFQTVKENQRKIIQKKNDNYENTVLEEQLS